MRRHLRHLFPPSGVRYELFDSSVLLLVFGFVGYVLTKPPTNTSKALSAPLLFITETQLGWVLVLSALFAIFAAYSGRLVRWGYIAATWAALTMSLNFCIGYFSTDASARTVLSIFLYGWIARSLMRRQRGLW